MESYEIHHVLPEGEMRSRRWRSTIDAVTRVISPVQEAWVEGKLAGMLLMDVKRTFDHISRNCLLWSIEGMRADGDVMR